MEAKNHRKLQNKTASVWPKCNTSDPSYELDVPPCSSDGKPANVVHRTEDTLHNNNAN